MTTQLKDRLGRYLPAFRYGTTHKKSYTDTHGVIDDGVSDQCQLVLVWTSSDAHIAVGESPEATTANKPVTAKVDTPVVVNPGDKISAIRQALDGDLYVTELL